MPIVEPTVFAAEPVTEPVIPSTEPAVEPTVLSAKPDHITIFKAVSKG